MKKLRRIIIVVGCLMSWASFGQYVTEWEFIRISKDTAFTQSQAQLAFIETPNNEKYKVTVTYEKIIPIVITNSYDNVDIQTVYSGTWSNGPTTATGFTNNTLAWSVTPGSTLTFNFTGTKLEWFSEFKSTHGRAAVTIDGVEDIVNLAEFNTGPGIVKTWDMAHGPHTVTIRVMDSKAVVHDGIRVTSQ